MHHRGQLMTMQRMNGIVPHVTRAAQERMAADGRRRDGADNELPGRNPAVSARAQAQQSSRVVQRPPRRLRGLRPPADDRDRRAAGGRSSRVRARARREPEGVDVPHLPRHALLREQDALQDARRGGRFRRAGCAKHEGAGAYFHISPDEVWIGGGMYAPQPPQLFAVREHIAGHLKQLRAIVESPGFRKHVRRARGREAASACRAGFAKDHPAAEYPQVHAASSPAPSFRRRSRPSPAFYKTLLTVFRQITPLTRFLNAPLLKG